MQSSFKVTPDYELYDVDKNFYETAKFKVSG